MLPFSMFLALQPSLEREWTLSNTASGWISSAYFAGYMIAVPVLSSLTDRIDARTVWLGACAMAAVGAIGFGLGADGVWSAAAFQAVAGIGRAGKYMPGLKVIADRLPQPFERVVRIEIVEIVVAPILRPPLVMPPELVLEAAA